MRGGIVIVVMSFDIEKDKARFPVAHDEIKGFARREFFEDELIQGCA